MPVTTVLRAKGYVGSNGLGPAGASLSCRSFRTSFRCRRWHGHRFGIPDVGGRRISGSPAGDVAWQNGPEEWTSRYACSSAGALLSVTVNGSGCRLESIKIQDLVLYGAPVRLPTRGPRGDASRVAIISQLPRERGDRGVLDPSKVRLRVAIKHRWPMQPQRRDAGRPTDGVTTNPTALRRREHRCPNRSSGTSFPCRRGVGHPV